MSERERHTYEFGPFRLDPAERLLLREGRPVALTPKAFEVLVALVSRSGRLVEKEELLREVWPDSFVEEANLSRHVYALRQALGGDEGGQGYIETVPKHGYRFVAEVQADDGAVVAEKQAGARVTVAAEGPSPEHGAIDSLAVLPFTNTSANPDLEYFSDGITESIINSLSRLSTLRVTARGTGFRFKGREVDAQELGRELKVGAVLTGRVLQVGGRLVIRTELVDAANGWQLWGAQYNREPSDIFAVEEEIASEISDNLRLKLTGREQELLTKRHTQSTAAYHAYLKGRYYENKRTEEGLKRGIKFFQEAIELDPCYALAYSGLADCYAVLGTFGGMEPERAFPKAKSAALKALEIDDTLAEAHTSFAFVKQLYDWNWAGAERGYRRALELNPSYATAHFWCATLFAATGRPDESIKEIGRAQEIDPLSLPINTYVGWALYFARQYDQAIEQYRKTLEMDESFVQARWRLGLAYVQKGMCGEAVAELERGRELSGGNPLLLSALGYAYAAAGRGSDALKIIEHLEELSGERHVSPYHVSVIYAGLRERERALEWLARAYESRIGLLIYVGVEPIFDALRADARFADFLRRVNLTPRSQGRGTLFRKS